MKKQTTYGRKLARLQREKEQQQAEQALFDAIQRDVEKLQMDAGLHTFTGNSAADMVNLGGRLCYIVAYAAVMAGFKADYPELRILRGMAEALGDLADNLNDIERHRLSIQSGLTAIDRLLPNCHLADLLQGSFELDTLLHSTKSMGTQDVRALMEPAL